MAEFKKNVKFSKSSIKDVMIISKAKPIHITGRKNLEQKRSVPFKDTMRKPPVVKELQEKKYMFHDSDLPGMLDDLLEKGLI